jgi:predicted transcriptional regulator
LKKKAHHLAIRCDSDLFRVLGDVARANDLPVSVTVRQAIREYCDTKPKPEAGEAVALVGALVEAIGSDAVRDRFLAGLKVADELNTRIGNAPSPAVALVTAALQRKAA